MTDYSELKRLAEAMPNLDWDSEFENHEQTGFCSVFAKPFDIGGETHEGPVFVQCCTAQQAEFIAGAKAAVMALIAENERLASFKAAFTEWDDRTEWVQKSAQTHELGMHRADAMKGRIDRLQAEVEALRKDAERYHWLRDKSESTNNFYISVPLWFTNVRVKPESVDAYIDSAINADADMSNEAGQ